MKDRIIDDINGYIRMAVEEDKDPLALAFISCQAFEEFASELAVKASSHNGIGSVISNALDVSSELFKAYWNLRYRGGHDHD